MLIHEKVKLDLSSARKAGEDTNNLQYVLGEFSRLKGSKDGKDYIGEVLTDEQAIRVLNSIITGENKILELVREATSSLKPLCESYLPKQLNKDEIISFINTIDFSKLKNKMMAVGIVKKKFGTAVDGKLVSEIVKSL